jgi:hypothetical protein
VASKRENSTLRQIEELYHKLLCEREGTLLDEGGEGEQRWEGRKRKKYREAAAAL